MRDRACRVTGVPSSGRAPVTQRSGPSVRSSPAHRACGVRPSSELTACARAAPRHASGWPGRITRAVKVNSPGVSGVSCHSASPFTVTRVALRVSPPAPRAVSRTGTPSGAGVPSGPRRAARSSHGSRSPMRNSAGATVTAPLREAGRAVPVPGAAVAGAAPASGAARGSRRVRLSSRGLPASVAAACRLASQRCAWAGSGRGATGWLAGPVQRRGPAGVSQVSHHAAPGGPAALRVSVPARAVRVRVGRRVRVTVSVSAAGAAAVAVSAAGVGPGSGRWQALRQAVRRTARSAGRGRAALTVPGFMVPRGGRRRRTGPCRSGWACLRGPAGRVAGSGNRAAGP